MQSTDLMLIVHFVTPSPTYISVVIECAVQTTFFIITNFFVQVPLQVALENQLRISWTKYFVEEPFRDCKCSTATGSRKG